MSSGTMNDWMAPLNVFGATMGGGAIPDQSDIMGRIKRLGIDHDGGCAAHEGVLRK
jgi:hypothetical protein